MFNKWKHCDSPYAMSTLCCSHPLPNTVWLSPLLARIQAHSCLPSACPSWSIVGLRVLQDDTPQGKYLPKEGKSLENSILTVLLEECGISIKTSL